MLDWKTIQRKNRNKLEEMPYEEIETEVDRCGNVIQVEKQTLRKRDKMSAFFFSRWPSIELRWWKMGVQLFLD